ncbi:PREDICTED: cuticle protein 2-like [Nicrophorus vespilloides]|uniref:Cuticle protein 2-like n=1 Tax=Nicrophorus vespilloides TaxID=110193 RepID=A0ABM1MQQ1_NICVS|nr:PREDICTED: cuticle protein 2-like [Nicrophorus vespilloides]
MKFFVVFACALAVASAGYEEPKYHGPLHLAVIGKGGVPVDTAEVQHARAAHFLHKAEAEAKSGHGYYHEEPKVAIISGTPAYEHGSSHAYEQHIPIIVKGVPVDTVAVQHARAAHLEAHAAAKAHDHHHYH